MAWKGQIFYRKIEGCFFMVPFMRQLCLFLFFLLFHEITVIQYVAHGNEILGFLTNDSLRVF